MELNFNKDKNPVKNRESDSPELVEIRMFLTEYPNIRSEEFMSAFVKELQTNHPELYSRFTPQENKRKFQVPKEILEGIIKSLTAVQEPIAA